MPLAFRLEKQKRLTDFLLKDFRENPPGYLFANHNGDSYVVGKVTEHGLWPVQKASGIERTTLHAFRHLAVSETWKMERH
jgi:hypothetical protein